MVAHTTNHVQHDERDDQQHIQTQRLLAMRVIAPPKSRLGQLIQQRLAELYEKLGEDIDPAKRRELIPSALSNAFDSASDSAPKFSANTDQIGNLGNNTAAAMGPTANVDRDSLAAQLENRTQALADTTVAPDKAQAAPSIRNDVALQNSKIRQSQRAAINQSNQVNWVWMLSMVLKTDLKRLGLEPDEFDDIRIFLIKSEAKKFDKLELLSRLPDSLSPEAITKIFEDIRTMAAGYVAFVLIERVKSDLERGEEVKQMPEVPRSVSDCFYGIPMIDFEPEDVLKKIG